jgi:hypothetical protein
VSKDREDTYPGRFRSLHFWKHTQSVGERPRTVRDIDQRGQTLAEQSLLPDVAAITNNEQDLLGTR